MEALLVFVCLLWVGWLIFRGRILYLKRDFVLWKLKRAFASASAYLLTAFGMIYAGRSIFEGIIGGLAGGFLVAFLWPKHRYSRRIPKHIRRKVIARDLGNTPFDPNKHHLDHIVPFSEGGGHTLDNLRVVTREENLFKGNKMPGLRDLFG